MATMLKIVVSVAVCLAYLCLEAEAAAVAANQRNGDGYNGVQGPGQCPTSENECIRSICNEHCESLNYRSGRCIKTPIRCNDVLVFQKQCICTPNAADSEESAESANAAEGSSSNGDRENANNTDSNSSIAKTPAPSKPAESSNAAASNAPTKAPVAAATGAANPKDSAVNTANVTPATGKESQPSPTGSGTQ